MKASRFDLRFGGLFDSLAQSKIPQDRAYTMSACDPDLGILQGDGTFVLKSSPSGAGASDVGRGLVYGEYAGNTITRLAIPYATGATWTPYWQGPTTGASTTAISRTATADQVRQSLESHADIEPGDVRVVREYLIEGEEAGYLIEFIGQYRGTAVNFASASVGTVIPVTAGGSKRFLVGLTKLSAGSTCGVYVHSEDGTWNTTASALSGAAGTNSRWSFSQFGYRAFGVNATDGLGWFDLGDPDPWALISSPNYRWFRGVRSRAPLAAPTVSLSESVSTVDDLGYPFNDATPDWTFVFTDFAGAGAAYTAGSSTSTAAYLNSGNAAMRNKEVKIQGTWTAPGLGDLSDYDWFEFEFQMDISDDFQWGDTKTVEVYDGTTYAAADYVEAPYYEIFGSTTPGMRTYRVRAYFHGNETVREAATGFRITLQALTVSATKVFLMSWRFGKSHLNDLKPFIPSAPIKSKLTHAYSYWDATNNLESGLSDWTQSGATPGNVWGAWVNATVSGNADLTASDKIRLYRLSTVDGTWRRAGLVANVTSGTTIVVDRRTEEDLLVHPVHAVAPFGENAENAPTCLATWKGCLVVGAGRNVWISWVNQPERFVDPDDPAGATSVRRGATFSIPRNDADDLVAIVADDSIYAATATDCYAMVGDSPIGLSSPRRLPSSRGAVGARAMASWRGGALVAASDGLWFYKVDRGFGNSDQAVQAVEEVTREVRTSYEWLLAGGTDSDTVLDVFQDRWWLFCGARYLRLTKNGNVVRGTLGFSVEDSASDGDSFWLQSTTGLVYEWTPGTKTAWTYETPFMDFPERVQLKRMRTYGAGTVAVTVTRYDGRNDTGTATVHERGATREVIPVALGPMTRCKLSFAGAAADTVETFALELEASTEAVNN